MDKIQAVQDFFDRHVNVSDEVRDHLGMAGTVSRSHLIHHLVERTIRRASVDAATQRLLGSNDEEGVSWERCLVIAALAELRPLRLLARQSI